MKDFKIITLCLLGFSIHGLQAMREAESVEASREVQEGKGQQEENEENIARQVNMNERENVQIGKTVEKVSMIKSFKIWFTKKFPNSSWFRAKSAIKKDAQQVATKAKALASTTHNFQIAKVAEKLESAAQTVKTSANASDDVQSQSAVSLLQAEADLVEAGKNASPADQDAINQIGESLGSEHKQLLDAVIQDNPMEITPFVEHQTTQRQSFLLGQPEGQVQKQVQNSSVSSRQSLTLQSQESVVNNAPVRPSNSLFFNGNDLMSGASRLRNSKPNNTLQSNDMMQTVNDGIVGVAKTDVVNENQQAHRNLFEQPQVEKSVIQEAAEQGQGIVVENPNAARIQELQSKGKSKSMAEAAELRRLTTQSNEQVVDSSIIKQSVKMDSQAVDAQAMDAKTVENINKIIEQFNKSDIDVQVQNARDAYDQQYLNKVFGYKNTTAYKNGLKIVEAQAKDQVLSDVKNQYTKNADGSLRSNREVLNALNAKYRSQSPAKSVVGGSKASGSNLTLQQEMRVKQIMRENPSMNKDDAITQMRSEAAIKESGSNSTDVANRQEVIFSNEVVVSQADIDRQIYNDNKSSIDVKTQGLKGIDLTNARKKAVASIRETLSDNDLAMYKDKVIAKQQAEAKALADKEKERAAQIKAAKMKNEPPVSSLNDDDLRLVNNQIYENNKIIIDAQMQDAAVDNPVLLRSSQMAKQFKLDAANKIRQTMSDDQQSVLLQQAKDAVAVKELAAAQAPVQETVNVEAPKMSLADQLAAQKAKKAAKLAAQQAAQQ